MKYAVEMPHTKFHKDWLWHSKVDGGGVAIHRHTDIMVIT
jgi:hypothetical protein